MLAFIRGAFRETLQTETRREKPMIVLDRNSLDIRRVRLVDGAKKQRTINGRGRLTQRFGCKKKKNQIFSMTLRKNY